MLKILLAGCNGRMGRVVTQLVDTDTDAVIVAGIDRNTAQTAAYPVYAQVGQVCEEADVLIDFSTAAALDELLPYALAHKLALLLAATGHTDAQRAALAQAARQIPIFHTPNLSLGVAVLQELAVRAARILGESYDVEIVEKHHNQKLDAPSGTALLLAQAVHDALPQETEFIYDRHERRMQRPTGEIGIHSVRGGTIVGEHEVLFCGFNETISVSHTAQSREVFAVGALRAAHFLPGCKPGIYNMADLVASIL